MTNGYALLRDKALSAWEAEEADRQAATAERRREAQERERERQEGALALVGKSFLSQWFPDQEWEYVGLVQDGVVTRAAGSDLLFVVVRATHVATEPQHFSILICREGETKSWLVGAVRVSTLGDIGRVIAERERPKPVMCEVDASGERS